MIKKEYKLVSILGSRKELIPRHLIQKKNTHQFGTVHPSSLRGKQARRNLLEHFDPVSLYLVDSGAILHDHELGILTLKDGSRVLGISHDYLEDDIAYKEKILYFQRELFDCWVDPPYLGEQHERLPYFRFRTITPRNLQLIFERGGKVWLEMEAYDSTAGIHPFYKIKLHENRGIIHLVP